MNKELKERYSRISKGIWSDTVLEILGKPHDACILGKDGDGLVILWRYPFLNITLAKAKVTSYNVEVYAVQKIEETADEVIVFNKDAPSEGRSDVED